MKKHSLYLRSDQISFLKSLPNASSFIRECLDVAISETRGNTERTICLYEGAKELEAKITNQVSKIKEARAEAEKIEEQNKEAQRFLKVAHAVSDGKFEVEQENDGTFRILFAKEDGRFILVTDKHETEEEAKSEAIEKGKSSVKAWKADLKEAMKKKKAHEAYVRAQQAKLGDMKKNLEKLYASMK